MSQPPLYASLADIAYARCTKHATRTVYKCAHLVKVHEKKNKSLRNDSSHHSPASASPPSATIAVVSFLRAWGFLTVPRFPTVEQDPSVSAAKTGGGNATRGYDDSAPSWLSGAGGGAQPPPPPPGGGSAPAPPPIPGQQAAAPTAAELERQA